MTTPISDSIIDNLSASRLITLDELSKIKLYAKNLYEKYYTDNPEGKKDFPDRALTGVSSAIVAWNINLPNDLIYAERDINIRISTAEELRNRINSIYKLTRDEDGKLNVKFKHYEDLPDDVDFDDVKTISRPTSCGNYLFNDEISSGSYGKVYHVTNTDNRKDYALKINQGGLTPVQDSVREIAALKFLSSPYIISLKDVVFDCKVPGEDGGIGMSFELADIDLYNLLASETFTFNNANKYKRFKIASDIICALEIMHANNIGHYDLKPENILIMRDGSAKIIDLGMSNSTFSQANSHQSPYVVSSWYRPPEIFCGAKIYKIHVDIWSLGIIFCQLFFGFTPFYTDNDDDDLLLKDILGTIPSNFDDFKEDFDRGYYKPEYAKKCLALYSMGSRMSGVFDPAFEKTGKTPSNNKEHVSPELEFFSKRYYTPQEFKVLSDIINGALTVDYKKRYTIFEIAEKFNTIFPTCDFKPRPVRSRYTTDYKWPIPDVTFSSSTKASVSSTKASASGMPNTHELTDEYLVDYLARKIGQEIIGNIAPVDKNKYFDLIRLIYLYASYVLDAPLSRAMVTWTLSQGNTVNSIEQIAKRIDNNPWKYFYA